MLSPWTPTQLRKYCPEANSGAVDPRMGRPEIPSWLVGLRAGRGPTWQCWVRPVEVLSPLPPVQGTCVPVSLVARVLELPRMVALNMEAQRGT